MSQLSEYKTLQEKSENFSVEVIDTMEKFDTFWSKNIENQSIWRGVPEAKWMLYTSLQRFWIGNDFQNSFEEVKNYLHHIISEAKEWNYNFIENYLKNYGFSYATIYTYLSILRHYGAPTPLLDWSRELKVGLFFGAYYSELGQEDHDISDYFSLYCLSTSHPIVQNDLKRNLLKFFWEQSPYLKEQLYYQEQKDKEKYLNEDEIY